MSDTIELTGGRAVPARTHAPTPGQTVGPFFAYGVEFPRMNELVPPRSPGAIVLEGTVRDGLGSPIPDAFLEIWQTDADGAIPTARGTLRRDGRAFTGFGRGFTDDEGGYHFWTVEPGAATGRAAFISVVLYARGLPNKLHTRAYVPAAPGDAEAERALATDPLLSSLSADERATLIATRTGAGLRFDIRLQGEKETVFLAY